MRNRLKNMIFSYKKKQKRLNVIFYRLISEKNVDRKTRTVKYTSSGHSTRISLFFRYANRKRLGDDKFRYYENL